MKIFVALFVFLTLLYGSSNQLNVGVLAYGTVNWELMTIKSLELDKKYGFDLQIKELASKDGVAVAFQAESVDVIVNDWVWVNRQNYPHFLLYFYPYSTGTGGIYTNNSRYRTLGDLKGKKLGVAGGPMDKSWLLYRAYAQQKLGIDLSSYAEIVFAAPPILNAKLSDGSLDAVLNFWHYNVLLDEKGMTPISSVRGVLGSFGINNQDIPFTGWVFKRSFAAENKKTINAFLQASLEANAILKQNDAAWNALRPFMHVKDDAAFEALKKGYREGIPEKFTSEEIKGIEQVYALLEKTGGKSLVGESKKFDKTMFWPYKPNSAGR
ncbi:ABC transporter substrate-binding protein [Sulfuricurvum sp.]|uniref:ABC transporter substrate-binding protein n=1 Tax=Sulfuricurvum sp. TaxID=2025608 RepID=UPI0026244C89|nr:ABC transporter substrate-binding protein [Sulfuricurvum sp.]MDD2266755.1 ABC transporter substrate-binding protein [Sulfuricurvum sp.]MDD2784578.1 ABC transporter substrate-binding protein [Sulfuricurvum sp.]